jgi:tRNA nucleotidyltransferase (CCA-adding enzyme)
MLNVSQSAKFICEVLKENNQSAWLVGGAVRDSFMGRAVHDWDIATSALPVDVQKYFPKVIPTGIDHGTVTIMIDGEGYEVTTYRGEGEYTDGRHPDKVNFLQTIEEDLARRDFTINAMAYDPIKNVFCDPYNGQADIAQKVIRAVGNAKERFLEDGLRVLRAIRFGAVLGFSFDQETIEALKDKEVHLCYQKVSKERVRDELMKIMLGAEKPSIAFQMMLESGLLEITIPEMMPMVGCEQNKYHEFDVWNHTMATLDATPKDFNLRFAALFHDVGKPEVRDVKKDGDGDFTFYEHEVAGQKTTQQIMERLRFSNDEINKVSHLVRYHYIKLEKKSNSSAMRRWIRRVGKENIDLLFDLSMADIKGKGNAKTPIELSSMEEIRKRVNRLEIESGPIIVNTKGLAINGEDIMKHLGIGQGPQVGVILKGLLELVTDEPAMNNRKTLLEQITKNKEMEG